MKKEIWKSLKFHVMLGVRAAPRLFVAPYVGAFRAVLAVGRWIDTEIADFDARQLKARETSIPDAKHDASHA